MIESRNAYMAKKHKVKGISRQQMVDCVKRKNKKCKGNKAKSFKYAKKNALFYDHDYSKKRYTGKKGTCQANFLNAAQKVDTKRFKKHIVHKKLSVVEMKYLLLKGPLVVSVDAKPDEFRFYQKGILRYECKKPNHSMLLVGYYDPRGKDKKIRKYLKKITGLKLKKPVWILRNSWGEKWGSKGNVYMEMSDKWDCGMYRNVVEFLN